jgi:pyruvate decarboxylase
MLTAGNRGEFTEQVKDEVIVDFQRFYVKIGGVRFDAKMKYVSSPTY